MPYVNVDVHVDLDVFDDDDILSAAVDIVRNRLKGSAVMRAADVDAQIEALKAALLATEESECEPLSTAARLRTMDDLRTYVETKSGGLFHFAGPVQ